MMAFYNIAEIGKMPLLDKKHSKKTGAVREGPLFKKNCWLVQDRYLPGNRLTRCVKPYKVDTWDLRFPIDFELPWR